jgi:Flp pilus assembly protein TadG
MRRRIRSQRGAELIELAMVTPILIILMAAIIDFGMLFRSWEAVTNAAREGARVGVLPGYSNADVRTRVQQYMATSGVANACTLQSYSGGVCPATACSVCVQTGPPILTGTGSMTPLYVTVVVNQTMPSLGAFVPLLGANFGTIPLASTSAMRSEAAAGAGS